MGVGRLYLGKRLVRGRGHGTLLALAFAVCAVPLSPLLDLPPAVEASLDGEVQAMGPAISVVARQANLAVPGESPSAASLLPENITAAILALPGAAPAQAALPWLAGTVRLAGRERPAIGLDASQVASVLPWWSALGAAGWSNDSQAWVGRRLAQAAGLAPGGTIALEGLGGAAANLTVTAVLVTGGAEEDAVVMPLARAQALFGQPAKVSAVMLRVSLVDQVPAVASAIESAFPFLEARTVLKLVEGRQQLLGTFRLLALAVAASSAAAGALTAVSAGAVSLRGRVQELAILRALGARRREVVRYLGAEVAALGAIGTAAGFAAGLGLLTVLGPALFGVAASPSAASAAAAGAAGLAVGLLVLYGITREAARGELTEVLKGE